METVPLGSQGLTCGAMGLGCMGMTCVYGQDGTIQDEELAAVFKRAEELGVTMLNSAEFYGADRINEKTIAKHGSSKFQISLKVGGIGDLNTGHIEQTSAPKHLRETVDEALRILGRDYIDVIVQARQDPNTPIEDVMHTFKELVEAGKVKYVGLSEVGPSIIRKAHAIHPLTLIEQEWSIWSRDLEESIVPVCKELGIGILAYSPLGRGFLTGAIDKDAMDKMAKTNDFRAVAMPRLKGENFDKNMALVGKVQQLATEKGCEAGQIALAWVYAQAKALGVTMVPIPGTKRVKYLESNVAALQVKLTHEELQKLNAIGNEVVGDRYAIPQLMFDKDDK